MTVATIQHATVNIMNQSPLGNRGIILRSVASLSSRNIMYSIGPRSEADRIPKSELDANFAIKPEVPPVIVRRFTISNPSQSGIRLKNSITKASLKLSLQFDQEAVSNSGMTGKRDL